MGFSFLRTFCWPTLPALAKKFPSCDTGYNSAQLSNINLSFGVLTSGHVINCTERSRAIELKCEWECSLRPSETSLDKRVPQSKSVGSSDVRIDSVIVSQGVCEADGVATTSGTRAEPDLDMEKELPSTLLQDSPKQDNHVLSTTLSHNPSELPLASLLDQSVCKPPTLSIEEHIRQCEAMTNRVKGAGQLNNSHSTYSVSLPGTIEGVLNPGSNPPGGSLTVESHENQVVVPVAETSRNSGPPCGEELVTTIPSSSRARSPSLFNSQDADEDHVADTELIEVRKSSSRTRPGASKACT